jgi:hypothetical protein
MQLRRPSPTTIIASLALFLAVSGTALASRAVTARKAAPAIREGSPAGGVLSGSYRDPTFAGAVLYKSTPVAVEGGEADRDVAVVAYCPAGEKAISGGGGTISVAPPADLATFYNSEPTTGEANVGTPGQVATGWRVDAHDPTSESVEVVAYVLCVA